MERGSTSETGRDASEGSGASEGGEPSFDLAAARPDVDRLQLELARAKAEQQLFGKSEPPRVGRFVLLGDVAMGGMGAVYAAYDPQLARRVALKLLHPEAPRSTVRRERLLAEARALARLHHPNVVAVHDAVLFEDQVVVVMEWVEGQTLARWERAQPRSWREIVAAYGAAGRGLAAAHALGLVHRDFKPANAIVGDDGRVRILDFGLARFEDEAADEAAEEAAAEAARREAAEAAEAAEPAVPPSSPGQPAAAALTATGEVLGTLAFMAPEQRAGQRATAASDQFSFCVALRRALADVPRVPAGVRAAVERGAAPAPAARFPSMAALLAELGRVRGWRRWRTPAVAGAAATVGLIVMKLTSGAAPVQRCDGGAAEIADSWSAGQRGLLERAFAQLGLPDDGYVPSLREAVVEGLDGYRGEWAAMHRAACVAHREGIQSDLLLDQRMACLRRRKDALAAAATALGQIDATSLYRAREVVANLPPIADCADLELLAAAVPPPATPQARATAAALERRLAGAVALERLGRSKEALALVGSLVSEIEPLGYPPLLVEALITQGRIALTRDDRPAALAPLIRAEELALEHGLLPQATIAAARRIFLEARTGADLPGLLRQAALLEPLSRHLRGDSFARPLLLNNLGVLYMAMKDRDQALEMFSRARAALDGARKIDLELTAITSNLAMLTREAPRREALARTIWETYGAMLGDRHLNTLEVLLAYGRYIDDPAVALPVVQRACELYRTAYPELRLQRWQCEAYRGLLAFELGDLSGAAEAYDEVTELPAEPSSSDEVRPLLASGWAALHRGQRDLARRWFEDVLRRATQPVWWVRARAAQAHLGLGLLDSSAKDAISHLERALEIYVEVSEINEDTEHKRRLALTRATLARRLRAAGTDLPRAAALGKQAADFYRRAGAASYRGRLEELRAPS